MTGRGRGQHKGQLSRLKLVVLIRINKLQPQCERRRPRLAAINALGRGQSFVAIEVKTTANPAPPHFAGLRAIADLAGVKRRLLVHTGERAFNTPEGIEALPVMQFAREVTAGTL